MLKFTKANLLSASNDRYYPCIKISILMELILLGFLFLYFFSNWLHIPSCYLASMVRTIIHIYVIDLKIIFCKQISCRGSGCNYLHYCKHIT